MTPARGLPGAECAKALAGLEPNTGTGITDAG
jgi:hypothetical protein